MCVSVFKRESVCTPVCVRVSVRECACVFVYVPVFVSVCAIADCAILRQRRSVGHYCDGGHLLLQQNAK
jgi:hypothetical protein